MLSKFMNARNTITILSIAALILVLFLVGSNAKIKLVLQENKDLSSSIGNLKAEMLSLTKRLQQQASEIEGHRSELEEARNKLTQERLKNVQLQQQIEEIKIPPPPTPEEPAS